MNNFIRFLIIGKEVTLTFISLDLIILSENYFEFAGSSKRYQIIKSFLGQVVAVSFPWARLSDHSKLKL